MKKLLFLASFVFETGKIEYNDNQLVMVTDKDVKRSTEKQKSLNPDKGPRTHELDHYDAAYDVFHDWFKGHYPESTLKHIICNRPIQSELFPEKESTKETDYAFSPFKNWHKPEEIPVNGTEYESEQVLIDVNGNRNQFAIGYYDKTDKDWVVYHSKEYLELEHMKWTYLPIQRKPA